MVSDLLDICLIDQQTFVFLQDPPQSSLPFSIFYLLLFWIFKIFFISGPDDDEAYEENQVSQEMLEDRLVRLATREVMDLLCECINFINSSVSVCSTTLINWTHFFYLHFCLGSCVMHI